MSQPNWTEEELKSIAKNLRKPEGDIGFQVAERMNQGNGPMNMHTLAVLNPQAGQSILELGMGNGYFVKNILELDESITYKGCDYSADMVDLATKLNQNYVDCARAGFLHAVAENIPLPKHSFDQVFTVNTLYFWEDIPQTLSEINRLLKPDGRFVLSIRPKQIMLNLPVTKYDFKLFERAEVIEFLEKSAFVKIEVTHVVEPSQRDAGLAEELECLIFSAKKHSDTQP